MNPLYKLGALVVLVIGFLFYRQSLINDGIKLESDRRDNVANAELVKANELVKEKQSRINDLQGELSKLHSENENEKMESIKRESDLRAGNQRLRVQIAHRSGATGSCESSGTATVDQESETTQDLAPAVAGWLESFRRNENNAIDRLDACIKAYDEVREQVNAVK